MKSKNRKGPMAKLILGLTGVLWLAGCYGPSALDLDYGNAVRNNLAQSVLNPAAGQTTTPATGLSPTATVNEKELYDKEFKGEEKKPPEMKVTY
jgi:hypothetical protein